MLQNQSSPSLPATAFSVSTCSQNRNITRSPSSGILPTPTHTTKQPRPFLGKCQWCRAQDHVVSKCSLFKQQFPNANPPSYFSNTRPHSTPQAHTANLTQSVSSSSTPWLLDSGALHHVTTDLNNLSLHAPYDGTEELIVGDGKGLKITHFGSISFSNSIVLHNVLVVITMSKIVSRKDDLRDGNRLDLDRI